jgi:hypothetical protein
MLEIIHEYALEQLTASDEETTIRAHHADYYLGLAEAAVPQLRGPAQLRWLDWLEADHDNLRAACAWFLTSDRVEEGLRLVGALHWFWDRRGYLDEGRARIQAALDAAANIAAPTDSLLQARAWALVGAAALAFDQGDRAAVAAFAEETAALFRKLDDRHGLTLALLRLAFVRSASEPQQAGELLAEAVEYARASGDPWFVGLALFVSAQAALFGANDTAVARTSLTEALPALHASGSLYLLAHGMATLGLVALTDGDLVAARACVEDGLALIRTLRDTRSVALLAATTADAARCQGDCSRCGAVQREPGAVPRARQSCRDPRPPAQPGLCGSRYGRLHSSAGPVRREFAAPAGRRKYRRRCRGDQRSGSPRHCSGAAGAGRPALRRRRNDPVEPRADLARRAI